MRVLGYLILSLVLPAAAAGQVPAAGTAGDAAVYQVAYVEVMPASTREAVALLRQYREASRAEAGNLRLEVFQQSGRPDHLALVELWRDERALDAHLAAEHTKRFREALERLRVSPYDERLHRGLAVGASRGAVSSSAIYVLTHADAVPASRDDAVGLLTALADAARGENGNVRFDVLQQSSRLNHFTVFEIWENDRALEAHAVNARTRQFRDAFQPLSGALWDERLYRMID